jgi:3-oxoacyl-[acyl-carrier-protein] synthase-3
MVAINDRRAVGIAGMGVFLPARRVLSEELDEVFGVRPGWTERATGVVERRYVRTETTEQMAADASLLAMKAAGISPGEVDLVIGAATSARQLIPCTAVFVQRELGLPEGRSACFDVNATCLSWLVAMDIAAQYVSAGRARCALIVTSEIASGSLNPSEPESAALFGDAAVATIVMSSAGASRIGHVLFETHSSGAELAEFAGGGTRHHPNDPATCREANMFRMQGRALFKMACRVVPPFLDRFMNESGERRQDFDAVVPHQASKMGLDAVVDRFGFRRDQLITNLATRGNCIAASIPLALAEAIDEGRIRRGDRLLLTGTGAGVTLGAMDMVY